MAERARKTDEGRPRTRGCAGAVEVQHRGVSTPRVGLQRCDDRSRTIPGEVATARWLEGHRVQQPLRRHVQRLAPGARPPLRMASAGVLPQITQLPDDPMIHFVKAHAYGNDFLYVR